MAFIPIERTSCLDSAINIDRLSGAMFTQENEAHQFVITCTQNNAQLTLTGTITAKVVLANGNTVELVGTIDGGKAVVTLTQPCYNTAGRIQISIFNTVGSTKLCIYAAIAYVQTAEHGDLIDGSQIIDSVEDLIADIQAAVATIPPDYSTLSNQVADLKSAFDEVTEKTLPSSNLFPGVYETGMSLNADGSTSDNPDRSVTDFIPVDALTSYYTHYGVTQGLVNFIRANCYGADKTTVLSAVINTNTFTTPVGTKFVRICSTASYFDTYYAITKTQEANPYEEYRQSEWVAKTDNTLTDEYLPANAKAVGDAIAEQNETIYELSEDITYIDTIKNRVYTEKVSRNLMPSVLHETNILADGTYEENAQSYAASVKFEVKPYSKIIFTRKATAQTRALERFKAVFFNGDNVVLSDTTMSASARSVPANATHVIVGFYESYSTTVYAPMIEYGDGTNISNEYEAYYAPYDEYKPSATQRNSDKKLCVFGDSLAANGNGGNDYWAHIVGAALGFDDVYNRGVGSSRVADTATLYAWVNADGDSYNRGAYAEQPSGVPSEFNTQIDACMSGDDRALTIPLDTDVLLILAGANDASTIGTIGIEAFKTAYRTMLDKIYARVPNAKTYLCTPPFNANWDMGASAATYQSIRVAVSEIGQEYGFPVIDLKGEMMVNKNNYETYMNTDGVHFNTDSGRKITAEAVIPHLYGFMYVR